MNIVSGWLTNQVTFTAEFLAPQEVAGVTWKALETRANGSFFTSWTWIGSWLQTYAATAHQSGRLMLVTGRSNGTIVVLGIIGKARTPWFRAMGANLLLHQTGEADDFSAFIEYNGFLIDKACAGEIEEQLFGFLNDAPIFANGDWAWRSLSLPGLQDSSIDALVRSDLAYRIQRKAHCPWVALTTFSSYDEYLSRLSANTRQQIRRSVQLFAASGEIKLKPATSKEEALSWFQDLRILHEKSWLRRGKGKGAFSHSKFSDFCAVLIESGHSEGRVDLLRITAGTDTIAILLNFVYEGEVYAYQSGLMHHADNRLKPGLVSHAMAIAHYAARGLSGYHFMAGDARYKTSLGTLSENLTWCHLHRDDAFSRVADILRSLKTRLFHPTSHSRREAQT